MSKKCRTPNVLKDIAVSKRIGINDDKFWSLFGHTAPRDWKSNLAPNFWD